jgi:hypothetical protein
MIFRHSAQPSTFCMPRESGRRSVGEQVYDLHGVMEKARRHRAIAARRIVKAWSAFLDYRKRRSKITAGGR